MGKDRFDITDGFGQVVASYPDEDYIGVPAIEALDAVVDRAQAQLDALVADRFTGLGVELKIDEVALYFGSSSLLAQAIRKYVRMPEVTHFNGATDHVKVSPFGTEYSVDYEFLAVQERCYRVECMALRNGTSPLHAAADARNDRIVHVSFKVPDESIYDRVVRGLDGLGHPYVLGQACLSTYGRFSYWRSYKDLTENSYTPWLKPRVNLRDGI